MELLLHFMFTQQVVENKWEFLFFFHAKYSRNILFPIVAIYYIYVFVIKMPETYSIKFVGCLT